MKLRSTAGGVIEVGDDNAAVYLAAGYVEVVETKPKPVAAKPEKPRAKRRGD